MNNEPGKKLVSTCAGFRGDGTQAPSEPAPGNPIHLCSNFFARHGAAERLLPQSPTFHSSSRRDAVQRVGEGRGAVVLRAGMCSISAGIAVVAVALGRQVGRDVRASLRPATDRRRSAWAFRSYRNGISNSPAYLAPVSCRFRTMPACARLAWNGRPSARARTPRVRRLRGAIFLQGALRFIRRAFRRCGQVDPASRSHRREDRTGSACNMRPLRKRSCGFPRLMQRSKVLSPDAAAPIGLLHRRSQQHL